MMWDIVQESEREKGVRERERVRESGIARE